MIETEQLFIVCVFLTWTMGNIKAQVYKAITLEMRGDPNPYAHQLTAGISSLSLVQKGNQLIT